MASICGDQVTPLRDRVAGLPPGIDTFFERAFARAPTERFQTAGQMAATFAAALKVDRTRTLPWGCARRAPRGHAPSAALEEKTLPKRAGAAKPAASRERARRRCRPSSRYLRSRAESSPRAITRPRASATRAALRPRRPAARRCFRAGGGPRSRGAGGGGRRRPGDRQRQAGSRAEQRGDPQRRDDAVTDAVAGPLTGEARASRQALCAGGSRAGSGAGAIVRAS